MTAGDGPFVELFREFAGSDLRDVWVFDEDGEDCLYIRDDVADRLDGHEPERYIDNERYGFITRRTYDDLTYASYQYTVRGFDDFTTFRTFLGGFGVLTSVDSGDHHEFDDLFDRLRSCEYEYDTAGRERDGSEARLSAGD